MRADSNAMSRRHVLPSTLALRGPTAIYLGLAVGYAAVLVKDLVSPDIIRATDFTVFWGAWHQILHGQAQSLFDEAAQRATQQMLMHGAYFEGGLMAFLNPPHAALAGVPFGWLADHGGETVAFIAWTAGNLALLALLVRALTAEWGHDSSEQRWMLVLSVLAFYPVFGAIKNGQPSVLLALAMLGVYRADKAGHHWAAGAWLTVLTIKPQLVPMVVIYLAARRSWRSLAAGAAYGAAAVVISAAVLGPSIWTEYARHVRYLEQFWGSGTPEYMVNLRGALTRLFGSGAHATIEAIVFISWLVGMAGVATILLRRAIHTDIDTRPAYACAMAVALVSNPHLFVHDAAMWTVPLILCAAAMRDAGADWMPFARFALMWPLLFAIGGFIDVKAPLLTWIDPRIWAIAAASIVIARLKPSRFPGLQPALVSRPPLHAHSRESFGIGSV
ncbi:MAG TPA: glycosyltransferase family 87 protein [Vicinamibacterales bacterium]|nr:glycosyltransferase family 87 protein [Vicinamibacterales bacterium]